MLEQASLIWDLWVLERHLAICAVAVLVFCRYLIGLQWGPAVIAACLYVNWLTYYGMTTYLNRLALAEVQFDIFATCYLRGGTPKFQVSLTGIATLIDCVEAPARRSPVALGLKAGAVD